jgi:hypothetical protein
MDVDGILKMDITEIGCELDWNHLAQEVVQ